MDLYSLFTLTLLAASSAFTPGPNNALVAAPGVNFGYRRTLPHIFSIALGFAVMIFIIGLFSGPAVSTKRRAARALALGRSFAAALCGV
ncbi:hypothetical protein ACMAY8_18680 [Rhodobacteraceae bacterium nBUS_22]